MKITFLCATVSQGGGSRVISIYAAKLLERGHDVTVVSRQPRLLSKRERLARRWRGEPLPADPMSRTVHFEALGNRHRWLPWKWPVEPEDLPEADILLATWWETAFEVAMMPPEKGAKAYFVQHHEVHDYLPRHLSSGSYRLPLKKITISDWLVETMARDYGDHDVIKVENGVDTAVFNGPPRDRNTPPRVGFMYASTRFKGVDVIAEAIDIARRTYPRLAVTAFGKSNPGGDLPLPKGTAYHLRPAQSRIPELYAECDAWLFGSRSEGFGLPLLEAMACRTPVVATRAGAAPDLLSDGRAGYCVNIDDSAALGARLVDLLSLSPEGWRSMSDAARARAEQRDWDKATDQFESALERLLECPR